MYISPASSSLSIVDWEPQEDVLNIEGLEGDLNNGLRNSKLSQRFIVDVCNGTVHMHHINSQC